MSELRYTPEQEQAILAKGRTIVSASAGSGKTFVMIQKLVELQLSSVSSEEILAVTFTKKAATQMREKLKKALIEKINSDSVSDADRTRLKEQLAILPQAEITTIDSFCSHLLKRYCYVLDIEGNFSVLEESSELPQLRNEALSQLFDEWYESGDESFFRTLSAFWKKKKDKGFRDSVLSAYDKVRTLANYRELLESFRYDEEAFEKVAQELLASWQRVLRPFADYFGAAGKRAEELFCPKLQSACWEIFTCLQTILEANDPYAIPPRMSFSTLPKKTKTDTAEIVEMKEEVKERKTALARELKRFDSAFGDRATDLADYVKAGETAQGLIRCVLAFDETFSALKRERAYLDYADLEQYVLELLKDEEIVNRLRNRYRYVFIDEYQDVNPVQEKILSIFQENVFLVGDAKQSIYGFRGSKSVFFSEKCKKYAAGDNSLLLTGNFRSAPELPAFVNQVFSEIMTESSCGIDYRNTSRIRALGNYQTGDGRVAIHIAEEEGAEPRERTEVYSVKNSFVYDEEIPAMARDAVKIVEEEMHRAVVVEGQKKMCAYGDIAVLARGMNNVAPLIFALTAAGIPVTTSSQSNICDFAEIKQLLDILSLIDNAEQDIPLASMLLSPVGNLTENDLTTIRLEYPKEFNYRTACRKYAKKKNELGKRLEACFSYLDDLRAYAQVETAGEVLVRLISETKMESKWLSQPNGRSCLQHVNRLLAAADGKVSDLLRKIKDADGIFSSDSAGEDAVHVMTIHASKGLEFPVVLLYDASRGFRLTEKDAILFDERHAFCTYAYDTEKKLKKDTILRALLQRERREECVKDELNLFYVALTRAMCSLHILSESRGSFSADFVMQAKCYMDFLDLDSFPGLLAEGNGAELPVVEKQALVARIEPERVEAYRRATEFVYPYRDSIRLPVKSSASALLRAEEYYFTPSLVSENEGLEQTSIAKGTAYHKFLQLADFSADTESEYRRLKDAFSEEEYALLDLERLQQIFRMPIFQSLCGQELRREQEFLIRLPACEVMETTAEDTVLYQGAIDLLAVGTNGITLLDYKFSSREKDALVEHYRPQLTLYRKAAAKILQVEEENISLVLVNLLRLEEIQVK